MKICEKCNTEREFSEFHKNKAEKDGLQRRCKQCCKEYREANRDRNIAYCRQYNIDNFEEQAAKKQDYYYDNIEYWTEYHRQYAIDNRLQLNERRAKRKRTRRQNDPDFRLKDNLRARIQRAIKKESRSGSSLDYLGCSIPFLKAYLESLFTEGMTWDNWGKGKDKWNIDHIVPLARFDLSDLQHRALATHYLNLQPLWSDDNVKKGAFCDF